MNNTVCLVIEITSIIMYLLSATLMVAKKNVQTHGTGKKAQENNKEIHGTEKNSEKLSNTIWQIAVILNGVIVVNNWLVNGYVPFVSMYQVLTFLALTFAPIYIFMKYMRDGAWMKRYFAIASAFCMTGVCFMSGRGVWHFPPALQSVWFVPHILAYMIAYSLVVVAFIITVISFLKKKFGTQSTKKDKETKSHREVMDETVQKADLGVYNLMVAAFPFMTTGMLFGAIWADAVWGDFWSFDAKENWSLVTWLMVIIYLHFRREEDLKKYAKIFVVLAFVGVLVTMIFVNMMGGSSSHTYSM
jgi:cytochrome c-type biogenesis protein CcsB